MNADKLAQILRKAIPYLREEGAKYTDDGSNEPLELAREAARRNDETPTN